MPESTYIHKHLFRMTHIENLRIILRDGMYAPNVKCYPDYINIGDESLIEQRGEFNVPIAPSGVLADYVPFYFGGRSPMLLNIKTGYRGVKQRNQQDIVYVCTHIDRVATACQDFCFTDGHAKDRLTAYFNNLSDLDRVDWGVVEKSFWQSTEDDPDRMRRKQAEFLIKTYVPLNCLSGIIVLDEISKGKAEEMMRDAGVSLPIHIDTKRKYYYND